MICKRNAPARRKRYFETGGAGQPQSGGRRFGRGDRRRPDLLVEETDIDGFNLSRIVTPEGLEDFVDLVVPTLQERGVYKHDYLPGTSREKLFAGSRLLPVRYPAPSARA